MIDRRTFGLGVGASAVVAAAPALSQTALLSDVDILQRAFTAMHPGLYRYSTPAEVDARFAALRRELSGGATLPQAYLALSQFTAKVRCGHTFVNPVNQSKATTAALFAGRTAPPVLFVWRNARMVVTRSLDPALKPGAEIVSMNGVPAEELLRRMMPISRADGAVDAKRVANLELTGQDRIAAFDAFLPRVAPAPEGTVRVIAQSPKSLAPRSLELAAITPSSRMALFAVAAESSDPPWSLMIQDGIGVLRMPTWALFDAASKWPAWLNAAFDRLVDERARGLVIDLRGNEGGADVGLAILARLVASERALPAYRRYVRYRRAPAELAPYLDTWDKSFLDWGSAATGPDGDGFYRMSRFDDEAGGDRVRPRGRRFAGKVAVLTEPANSSATFQFALAIRSLGLGLLVGRPTGGNLRGINGGAFFFLRLPSSGLEVDLPLIAYWTDTEQPDAGLEPDIRVVNGAADIAAGRDMEMHRARMAVA